MNHINYLCSKIIFRLRDGVGNDRMGLPYVDQAQI